MIIFIQYPTETESVTMQISAPGYISLVDLTMPELYKLQESIANALQSWPPQMQYGDLGQTDPDDMPF